MFLPATNVTLLPAVTLVSAEVVSSFVSTLLPFLATQKLSFTAFTTFSAVTNLPLSASTGVPTVPALSPVLLTVKSTFSTAGITAFNTPPVFVMVVPSTLTSSL